MTTKRQVFGPCEPEKSYTQHDQCTGQHVYGGILYECTCPCHPWNQEK